MVKTDKTNYSFLVLWVRNIWLLTASCDIDLNIAHILGCYNVIADTFSRIYSDRLVNHDILTNIEVNYIWDRVPATFFDFDTHL